MMRPHWHNLNLAIAVTLATIGVGCLFWAAITSIT